MATARPFNGFLSLFLFLLHLGCFFFTPNPRPNQHPPPPKRRKLVPLSSSPPSSSAPSSDPHKSLSLSIRSYLNHLFTFRNKPTKHQPQNTPATPISPPYSLQPPLPLSRDDTADKSPPESGEKPEISADTTIKHGSFSSRTEIFPCHACGEVLSKPQLLDLHQATKHALSELRDGESGKNIVGIIFQSGWRGKAPAVHRILKIHNTPRTLARFEEYREAVRSRAARHAGRRGGGVDERCMADGNERLRFYCSTILCSQERRGGRNRCPTGVCGSQFCSTCAIVRHGFSGKQVDLDGIATHANSWDAHVSLPHDLEEEFAFLHVQRAMLVCRVIAGRVARCGAAEEEEAEKGVFDSVVPLRLRGGPRSSWAEEEELLVFSPRAVLPCFIIIYTP